MVKWSPIREIDVRGKLLGYLVQYKEAWTQDSYYNISLQASASVAVIKGLKVFTLYRVQIAGFTSAGVGVQSRPQYAKTGTMCNEAYFLQFAIRKCQDTKTAFNNETYTTLQGP